MKILSLSILFPCVLTFRLDAAVAEYGDEDVLGTGTYASSPTAGATLQGLAPGVMTFATLTTTHVYPFTPSGGDFPGTDQIFVGSNLTFANDGYATQPSRMNGPQVFSLDYSGLVSPGQSIATLTLGIAADDFQSPFFGEPFIASINGSPNASLTALLNSLNIGGPKTQFVTLGLDPSLLSPSGILNVSIDEGGNGGDGWAVDFLTVGVTTTSSVPDTSSTAAMLFVSVALLVCAASPRRLARTS